MSNAAPEGRHTEAHAKAAAWPREHAMPAVLPNRVNANREAFRLEIAKQEAPPQENAAKAVHR
ncbi:MAG: hypothetical protein WCO89_10825 [Syntrophus sp. (in: bacteria)]